MLEFQKFKISESQSKYIASYSYLFKGIKHNTHRKITLKLIMESVGKDMLVTWIKKGCELVKNYKNSILIKEACQPEV